MAAKREKSHLVGRTSEGGPGDNGQRELEQSVKLVAEKE
jgi:hypothetical protein